MNASERNSTSSVLDCGINHDAINVLVPSLYFFIFIPALVLNLTVIWVLLQLKTDSTLMIFLKNLVAADLLMTLTIPIKAANKLPGAALGLRAFTCRYANVFFYTSMYISIILMGLISLERFLKTIRPCGGLFGLFGQSLIFGRIASAATWIALLGAATLPTIILTSGKPSTKCMEMKPQTGKDFHKTVVWVFNLIFWVILVQIVFCYTWIGWTVLRSSNDSAQRKTEAKVFIVLVVFLVCFTPYHIVRNPYTELQVNDDRSCTKQSLEVAKDFTLWLSATNVCLDPLIYFFLYKGFREKLWTLTKSVFYCS